MLLLFYFIILYFAVKHDCNRQFCLENNWKKAFSLLLLLFVINVFKVRISPDFSDWHWFGKDKEFFSFECNKVGTPELEFMWQHNDMRWRIKLSISAVIQLGFKLSVKLIEFTGFAETNSAHAEPNEDLSPWCLLFMENIWF